MAKFLITGGCGFVGGQLTERLIQDGHQVTVIDDLSNGNVIHPKSTFIEEDIRHYDAIKPHFKHQDGCFHLAAIPTVVVDQKSWFNLHDINLMGSLNVFNAAMEAGNIPTVYASSCGVYGNATDLPLKENLFIQPVSAYGCDKLSTELNAHFLSHDFSLPTMGLRFFNLYGPRQSETSPYAGVITLFINHLLKDETLTIYGDGEQIRDFVFVEDVVENLVLAMEQLKKGSSVINICTGQPTSINHLAKTLANLLNRECKINYLPQRTFDAQDSLGCQEKMLAHGFKVTHNLKDGLAKTVDYFKKLHSQSL